MSIFDCIGQDKAILRLQRARQSARVPHGYIFFGPEGVGKGLLARHWAKLLLCSQPIRTSGVRSELPDGQDGDNVEDCCDQCTDCKLVEAGTHPDLHIIEKELGRHTRQKRTRQLINLPIDVIREYVIEPAGTRPTRGRARIFIMEQAESMSTEAQNALLKTLEEPPPSTFLILISSQPQRFLPTIHSRCQSVRFSSLPQGFVWEKMIDAGVPPEEAQYWSDFSGGRLGVGLRLAGMEMYDRKCFIINKLSNLSYAGALELAAELVNLAKDYAQKLLKENPSLSPSDAERKGQFHWLEILIHAFSLALRTASGSMEFENQCSDQVDSITQIAAQYGALGCGEAIRATYSARRLFGANVNPTLIFESLMLDYLCYASPSVV
jgi:DNA polymerase III subunit delta'